MWPLGDPTQIPIFIQCIFSKDAKRSPMYNLKTSKQETTKTRFRTALATSKSFENAWSISGIFVCPLTLSSPPPPSPSHNIFISSSLLLLFFSFLLPTQSASSIIEKTENQIYIQHLPPFSTCSCSCSCNLLYKKPWKKRRVFADLSL